jgi:hypothetical protein
MTTMNYKGYEATVEYDEDAEIFHGEVADLRDVITFQGKSVAELKKALPDRSRIISHSARSAAKSRRSRSQASSSCAPIRLCTKTYPRPQDAPGSASTNLSPLPWKRPSAAKFCAATESARSP